MRRETKDKIKKYIIRHKWTHFPAKAVFFLWYLIRAIFAQLKYSVLLVLRRMGVGKKRYSEFRSLKNKHFGQRCFIVCTGPSLRAEDLDRLQGEICFSMNSIFKIFDKTEWRPSYYCLTDAWVYRTVSQNEDFIHMKNALIPNSLIKSDGVLSLEHYIQFPSDWRISLWRVLHAYWRCITTFYPKFSENAEFAVYNASTVTYSIMQIAVFMGFRKIYLLGCDCNYSDNKKHFVNTEYKKTNASLPTVEEDMILDYKSAKQYADSHGIKIYNATRGGKLEVFERVDFDTLFDKS